MKTEIKDEKKKLLTRSRVKKLVIILILIALVAAGFIHQWYLRSDKAIRSTFKDNDHLFKEAVVSVNSYGKSFGKTSVGKCRNFLAGIDETLDKLEDIGISYLSFDGHDIDFYSEFDHYYIFHTDDESVDKEYETSIDSDWGYLKTKKK
ncbi:MAG: hypothetical protein IJ645_05585 [Ruminococcus sp.]|nr:hypothetical protein [Ruminococcus sp.]